MNNFLLFLLIAILPDAVAPGHMLTPDLPEDKERLFMESVLKDQVLVSEPGIKRTSSDAQSADAYQGNSPEVSVQIPRVILRFKRPAPLERPEEGESSFDLTLDFRRDDILVRHSNPQNKKMLPGWKFPLEARSQWKAFLDGEGGSGVAVLMPQVNQTGQYVRAMLLCPRYAFGYKTKTGKGLKNEAYVESGYRAVRGLFSARATAKGGTVSGGMTAMARGSILTTPNISRAKEFQDQAYMKDPKINLEYLALASEQLPDREATGTITAAIQSKVEFHRPSGYRRVSTGQETFWLKEYQLKKDEVWFIEKKKKQIRVAPGYCYIMFKERLIEHSFTKEDFVLPERLSESAGEEKSVSN